MERIETIKLQWNHPNGLLGEEVCKTMKEAEELADSYRRDGCSVNIDVEPKFMISEDGLNKIAEFIRHTLDSRWDDYTNRYYGIKESNEEGMRRMDPEMYDMMQKMQLL